MILRSTETSAANFLTILLYVALLCIPVLGKSQEKITSAHALKIQLECPKFLREGDRIKLRAIVYNTAKEEISGQLELQVIDTKTKTSADGWFRNFFPNQYFSAAAKSGTPTEFYIEVPFEYAHAVMFKLFAHCDQWNDSLTLTVPVISNATSRLTHNNNFAIQRSYWLLKEHKKSIEVKDGYTLHVGDTIQTQIRIHGLVPNTVYTLEAAIPSSLNFLQTEQETSDLQEQLPYVFTKKIRQKTQRSITVGYTSVAQFSGSFIQPAVILKNNKGMVLHSAVAIESLHIE